MSENNNKPELHIVRDNGIEDISDDSVAERIDNSKRRAERSLSSILGQRNNENNRLSTVSLILIAVAVLICVYVISDFATGGLLYSVQGKISSAVYGGAADKFSVGTGGDMVYDFFPYDDAYAILTENGITYVNASGSVSSSQQITYSSPCVASASSRVLIYDKGNNSYSLHQNESMYSQQKTDGKIIDAAISSRKNYALAVRDHKSGTILYGMDETGKLIYQWNCPDGYISDVTLNKSGGKACVTVIDSVNAVLCSTVYILDFEYDSAYAVFEYTDETVIGTKFLSNRKIQVITDKNVYLISGKEQTVVYEYSSSDLCFTDMSDRYIAVITKDYSHDDTYNLTIFGKMGKPRCTVTVNGKLKDISVSEKSVSLLYTDKAETYSNRGKLVGCITDINRYDNVILNGNYLYVLSSDSVKKLPAYASGSYNNTVPEDESQN